MSKKNLLDCTLRDGSYITSGKFSDTSIRDIISTLILSNFDFIEVGYLNSTKPYNGNSTHWDSIERIADFITVDRKKSIILAMVDIDQFKLEDITPCDGKSIDGIRLVFYKHQIKEALAYARAIKEAGYELFMQPMVTIDYSINEYSNLCEDIAGFEPYAVSIVDSFGYMTPADFRRYFTVLDNVLPEKTSIGFHSHANMNLVLPVAIDVLNYQSVRKLIIDCSILGIGRGAGNLQTELIANYYNTNFNCKYNIPDIVRLIDCYIAPIKLQSEWGYSPYYFLTAYNECHPNYAAYLLENHNVSLCEFAEYLKYVPSEMKTKCRKPYVEELYNKFKGEQR